MALKEEAEWECLRQIVPNRWASVRKRSFTKCSPACFQLVECSFCFERLLFWFVQFCFQWFPLLFSFFLLLSLTLLYSLMACAVSVYYHFGILTAAASLFYGHMEFGLLIMMIVLSGLFSPLMVVTPASTCSVPTSFDVLSQCNGFQTDFASTSPFIRVPTPQNQGEILFLWLFCSATLCVWLVQVACAWWALCMSTVCVCVFLCIYVRAGE